MDYDPRKTLFDVEIPRFDVSGNKITGEWDHVRTPELERIRRVKKPFDTLYWLSFALGVALGCIGVLLYEVAQLKGWI